MLQCFLSRVFAAADSPSVLKGGTGLLIRLPGARYSQDLDLLHPSENLEAAIEELKELSESRCRWGPVLVCRGVSGEDVWGSDRGEGQGRYVPEGKSLLPVPESICRPSCLSWPKWSAGDQLLRQPNNG